MARAGKSAPTVWVTRASCDQSLKRLGLDYVDIFYSHRFDPDTPLEETMGALDHIVRSGRALYVGISSYNTDRTRAAAAILKDLGTPCLLAGGTIHFMEQFEPLAALKMVESHRLTLWGSVPSVFALLMALLSSLPKPQEKDIGEPAGAA